MSEPTKTLEEIVREADELKTRFPATPRTDAACNAADSLTATVDNLVYLSCQLEREVAALRTALAKQEEELTEVNRTLRTVHRVADQTEQDLISRAEKSDAALAKHVEAIEAMPDPYTEHANWLDWYEDKFVPLRDAIAIQPAAQEQPKP